jgi:hypothetical protein
MNGSFLFSLRERKEKKVLLCDERNVFVVILNFERYGGGPELARKAVRVGYGQQLVVEVRPLKLIVSRFSVRFVASTNRQNPTKPHLLLYIHPELQ